MELISVKSRSCKIFLAYSSFCVGFGPCLHMKWCNWQKCPVNEDGQTWDCFCIYALISICKWRQKASRAIFDMKLVTRVWMTTISLKRFLSENFPIFVLVINIQKEHWKKRSMAIFYSFYNSSQTHCIFCTRKHKMNIHSFCVRPMEYLFLWKHTVYAKRWSGAFLQFWLGLLPK